MLQLHGRLVSRHKSEYAGPCPFKGVGDDRFHWWSGADNWWCRRECADCPGEPCATGGMQGWFEDEDQTRSFKAVPRPPKPTMQRVYEYHHGLDGETLAYLSGRGIRADTARRYLVGKNCRRLTIPCIVKNGKPTCYGIKKRWIGRLPEAWIDTYTMEPGSQGRAIFNYNRLVGRRRWPYALIVEGVLDCMLLDQLGIPAVAPFGGGGVWDPGWTRAFDRVEELIIVADDDEGGEGLDYANRKLEMLGRGTIVLPPGSHKDVGEAYQAGVNIHDWLKEVHP